MKIIVSYIFDDAAQEYQKEYAFTVDKSWKVRSKLWRKRLALRASDAKPTTIPIYGDKEVRQRDNLMLKSTLASMQMPITTWPTKTWN